MPADPKLVALERVDSLAERAYLSLREQIATGGLAPGERVTERALGLRLGVSATPIREALRRLEQERLVDRVTARQLRIAAHSEASLRELMYTEAVVRAAAARFATEKISTDTRRDESVARGTGTRSGGRRPRAPVIAGAAVRRATARGDRQRRGGGTDRQRVGVRLALRVRAMHDAPEVGLGRIRAHRQILAALHDRDPDQVEALTRAT
jgi:DNA-binding GntR family transcriptional regulator